MIHSLITQLRNTRSLKLPKDLLMPVVEASQNMARPFYME